jgi:hypothetical protein
MEAKTLCSSCSGSCSLRRIAVFFKAKIFPLVSIRPVPLENLAAAGLVSWFLLENLVFDRSGVFTLFKFAAARMATEIGALVDVVGGRPFLAACIAARFSSKI